jgi:hypothetical protein
MRIRPAATFTPRDTPDAARADMAATERNPWGASRCALSSALPGNRQLQERRDPPLATAHADLRSFCRGHLVGDFPGPAQRGGCRTKGFCLRAGGTALLRAAGASAWFGWGVDAAGYSRGVRGESGSYTSYRC